MTDSRSDNLNDVLSNPELKKFYSSYEPKQNLFQEGDEEQDLYILTSGKVEILKGDKKITEITKEGTLFGEMSFLLGGKRTASVRAATPVETIKIPKEQIRTILNEFPDVSKEIAKHLAQRLDETSQTVYGLKEIADQLPDAGIITDSEGCIISWNRSAEKIYGWDWHQMRNKPIEEIYEDPEAFRSCVEEVKEKSSVREKILKIRHPKKGIRSISASTTALYDGHHNYHGMLSLARDVTDVLNMQRRYKRFKNWLVPCLTIAVAVAAFFFFAYPNLTRDRKVMSMKQQELKNQLSEDYLLISKLLARPFAENEKDETTRAMRLFFEIQGPGGSPYRGLVLLNRDLKVFDAYSAKYSQSVQAIIGSSYGGIRFQGHDETIHKVLALYRKDKDHPMGQKGIEVAFELRDHEERLGWLLFQMDNDKLDRVYGLDEEGLKQFRFQNLVQIP